MADKNLLNTLKNRGLIAQESHSGKVAEYLEQESRTFYVGFDPTADSLHIGHLAAIMCMYRLVSAGHKAICVVGGGTAMIGDPSEKTEMRKMMSMEELEYNRMALSKQVSKLLAVENVTFLNNAEWLLPLNYLNFMREYGIHFKVNEMIKNDIYKNRLSREEGLTVFELNYLLLQSYDYLYLHRKYGCTIQLGGSDQWANILGGVDLIRRTEGKEVYAVTWQLIARSDGKKMGKSESGAIWLDKAKTSAYDFYQWWVNIPDDDVEKFLNVFTFLEIDKISNLVKDNIIDAKKILAYEVTKFVHGEFEAQEVKNQSQKIFTEGNIENAPEVKISKTLLIGDVLNILDIIVATQLVTSKSKVRDLISGGGLYINDIRIDTSEIDRKTIDEGFVLRIGKKKYYKIVTDK